MQRKIDGHTGRTVYRCHNDFGPLSAKELKNMVPKIADFGQQQVLANSPPTTECPIIIAPGSYTWLWLGLQSRHMEFWCAGKSLSDFKNWTSGKDYIFSLIVTNYHEMQLLDRANDHGPQVMEFSREPGVIPTGIEYERPI
ncbi:serine/threonine-protein kinase [Penicillium chermesinum]|nr:serine/threonine-protein kinase [Penicillium chermesinum]